VSLWIVSGCATRTEDRVIVWVAADQESVQPILNAFEREMEGKVEVIGDFDVRAARASRLLTQLPQVDGTPPCDLFWDDEVLPTIRLRRSGRLQRHTFRVPTNWPAEMIADDGTWCGFATRARVLLVNREALKPGELPPASVQELADPRWRGRCGLATPRSGTSATHWAVLRERQGPESALATLDRIRENAVILADEQRVARAVSSGQLAWGLTDSDLAMIEKDLDYPVEIVFPDQASDQPGTLRIPNTVAILRGAAHPVAAARLADFLVTTEIEDRLAMGAGSHIPIHRDGKFPPAVLPTEPVRWMRVDFEAAADGWEEWNQQLQAVLATEGR